MKTLPQHIKRSIGEQEQVRFFCRRSSYEVVREFGLGVGSAVAIFCFVWDLVRWTENMNLGWLLVLGLFGAWYFIHELLEWSAEIHVITDYLTERGGVYYKFSGFFNTSVKEIPISHLGPVIQADESLGARLWSFATGVKMKRVKLSTEQNVFVNNKLMPGRFEKALKDVRGSPSTATLEEDPALVKMSRELRSIITENAIPDWKARQMLENLWLRTLSEEY